MNTERHEERPTVERPLLIGLAVDVSGSMLASIENRSGQAINRLESFRNSFDELIESGKEISLEGTGGTISPLVKLFAYGFGFGNPLSIIFGGAGPRVRDLLHLSADVPSTVTIDQLAKNWEVYKQNIEGMSSAMFGGTPMCEALRMIRGRFNAETQNGQYMGKPVLFILSDGEPTDGSTEEALELAQSIKNDGVLIMSCYVTDEDIAEPRHLYGSPLRNWPGGAKLMFECASLLPKPSPFEDYMVEYRWKVESGARLFTQINQSEILTEFMKIMLSPLKETARKGDDSVNVFVSYSHQDKDYLKQDSLLGFLQGLKRDGFVFWHDERIITSELWDDSIRQEMGKANIALVLVSQSFLDSMYCRDVEVSMFLKARSESGLKIFPIILSPCDWNHERWLSTTQFQPRLGQTIETDYKAKGKRKQLYLQIRNELKALGEEIRAKRRV